MNHHELLDVAAVSLSALAIRDAKFFARDVDGAPLVDVAAEASVDLGDLWTDGARTVPVETPAGTLEAAYLVRRWHGPDAPTLLYHHGSGEDPFDFGRFGSNSFARLFETAPVADPVNLVAVRAPFHDGSSTAYARAMGDLSNFTGMLASSTALVEALTDRLRERGGPVVVAGISLGGYVADLHRAVHGTADRYAPLCAGARPGEMFVSSAYRRMVADRALARPDHLRDRLDFEESFVAADAPCDPLLARHDRIVEFDVQRPAFDAHDLATVEKGHVTGALATNQLRDHVLASVRRAQ